MTPPFNLGTFREILDTYGADIQRWPHDVRDLAEDFLKNSEEAQALYMEALKLDKAINPASGSEPPAGLLDKILKKTEE